jgi:hypothetical protein
MVLRFREIPSHSRDSSLQRSASGIIRGIHERAAPLRPSLSLRHISSFQRIQAGGVAGLDGDRLASLGCQLCALKTCFIHLHI